MADSTITVAPSAGASGAEIAGADLSTALSDDSVAAIRQALLDHLVVFFRDQELTPRHFMSFARCFVEPAAYPFVKGLDDFPRSPRSSNAKRTAPKTGRASCRKRVFHIL